MQVRDLIKELERLEPTDYIGVQVNVRWHATYLAGIDRIGPKRNPRKDVDQFAGNGDRVDIAILATT